MSIKAICDGCGKDLGIVPIYFDDDSNRYVIAPERTFSMRSHGSQVVCSTKCAKKVSRKYAYTAVIAEEVSNG